MKGLPFEVKQNSDGTLVLQGSAAKKWDLSDVDKTGKKVVKTILKDDSDKIYEYWYLNPEIEEEHERMEQIQKELTEKYLNKKF
jgi:DUF971 family protein